MRHTSVVIGAIIAASIVTPGVSAAAAGRHPAVSPSYGLTWTVDTAADALTAYAANASGAASPVATITGASTGLDGPTGVAVGPSGTIYVTNSLSDSITEYAAGAQGDATPKATVSGAQTGLDGPSSVTIGTGQVWVTNPSANTVEAFSPGVSGNVLPAETIAGPKTQLNHPIAITVSQGFPLITVLNAPTVGASSITSYLGARYGNLTPQTVITGTTAHAFNAPTAITSAGFLLWVADGGAHSVTELISLFGGPRTPAVAVLKGAATGIDDPSGLAVDAIGELEVADASSHTVSVFGADAHGDAAPIRTITGVGSGPGQPAGLTVTGAAPAAPTDVRAAVHHRSATVRWDAPTATGGGLLGYEVETVERLPHGGEEGSGGGTGEYGLTTTRTHTTIHGLQYGRTYTFIVQAVNIFGTSPAGRSAELTPLSVPTAPAHVLAVGGDHAITVGWTKPSEDGGRPVRRYRVEYATCRPGALGCHFASTIVTASHRRVTITGLTAGQTYDLRVLAESSVGNGHPSKVVRAAVT